MSTQAILQTAVQRGDLCFLPLQVPSDPVSRYMLLHPEIVAALALGPEIPRMFQLQGELEAFALGGHMTVCFEHHRHKDARLGLLSPPEEGIWDIRCRHHSPGIRVLGRFAEPDWFVGLEWRPRSVPIEGIDKVPLSDTRAGDEWEFAIIQVIQRWDRILPGASYTTGADHRDFVTENSSRIGR